MVMVLGKKNKAHCAISLILLLFIPPRGEIPPSAPYSPTAANHLLHLNERQKFRNPNKTAGKTTALYIFSFMFLNKKPENKTLKRLVATIPRI
jgi:hypothetical protein